MFMVVALTPTWLKEHYYHFHVYSPHGKNRYNTGQWLKQYPLLVRHVFSQAVGFTKPCINFQYYDILSFIFCCCLSADDGEVYVWDMNTRNCVHKFRDEGCLNSTTLAASRDGQYLACG